MSSRRYEESIDYFLFELTCRNLRGRSKLYLHSSDAQCNILEIMERMYQDPQIYLGDKDMTVINELWFNHILSKNLSETIAVEKYYPSIEETTDDGQGNIIWADYPSKFHNFWRLFLNILNKTYPRYITLIGEYQKQESNLMNKLESITEVKGRDNETPQSSGIDPYDVKFTNHSNVGETVSKTDSMDIPSKLEELHRIWYNLYDEWCNEFDDLFITRE